MDIINISAFLFTRFNKHIFKSVNLSLFSKALLTMQHLCPTFREHMGEQDTALALQSPTGH